MKNLIIGETSQLSYFFPEDYIRISSRNIDLNYLKDNKWGSVYITFAEQRVHINDINYIEPNYLYVTDIIQNLFNNSKKIVVYSTCELWNNYIGSVKIKDKFDYTYSNNYCLSKEMLVNQIKDYRNIDMWKNIIIIHPFNFNSTYRKPGFLFSKVFDSIINKNKIEIGNTYFYRDMVHAKYIVERSIKAKKDEMVGSGRLYFVNDYIRDLYKHFNMNYNEYVTEKIEEKSRHSEKLFYSYQKNVYTYDMLLKDTIEDITDKLIEKHTKKHQKVFKQLS
jgi:nucleoside-diphosphate-sugar epimerase